MPPVVEKGQQGAILDFGEAAARRSFYLRPADHVAVHESLCDVVDGARSQQRSALG